MTVVGLDSTDNALIISIINKALETINESEINQIVISQTINTRYTNNILDTLYIYRAPVIVIVVLVIALTLILIGIIIYRNKYYKKLDIVNNKLEIAVSKANQANETKSRFLAQ